MRSKSQLRRRECPLCLAKHGIHNINREDWARLCGEHEKEYREDIQNTKKIGLEIERNWDKRIALKRWRAARQWTRAKLAEQLGTTETSIYRWETGRHPVPAWVPKFLAQLEE